MGNLAVWSGEGGRRVEALEQAQRAVTLREELVALNRAAYLPDLATSVNNLAADLGEEGREADAAAVRARYEELRAELDRPRPPERDQTP